MQSLTAGQNTEMNKADLTPNFLIVQPVTKRFRTPKIVVENPRIEIAIAVEASIVWTEHLSVVEDAGGSS